MFKFLYANELKTIFTVYGSYYDLLIEEDEKFLCRNVLEIFKADYFNSLPEHIGLSSSKPDSIFVMMNPGSSEPRKIGFEEPEFGLSEVSSRLSSLEMVFAKPDVTQYQVMRIMVKMEWNHVRVVNLSDIREPKSIKFFKKVEEFENKYKDIHTIFSFERKKEREKVFNLKCESSPIILGWGRDKKLVALAEKALKFLENFKITGVVSPDHPMLYSHPSPNIQTAKEEWLKKIYSLLR